MQIQCHIVVACKKCVQSTVKHWKTDGQDREWGSSCDYMAYRSDPSPLPPHHCFSCSISLGQWRRLQELMSRCLGMLICSQLDHFGYCNFLLSNTRKSACSWVYLHLHSTLESLFFSWQVWWVSFIYYKGSAWLWPWKAIRNQAETDMMSLPGSPVPDRLIKPEKYEPPFSTPQGHTTAEPTKGAHRRLIPAYT